MGLIRLVPEDQYRGRALPQGGIAGPEQVCAGRDVVDFKCVRGIGHDFPADDAAGQVGQGQFERPFGQFRTAPLDLQGCSGNGIWKNLQFVCSTAERHGHHTQQCGAAVEIGLPKAVVIQAGKRIGVEVLIF